VRPSGFFSSPEASYINSWVYCTLLMYCIIIFHVEQREAAAFCAFGALVVGGDRIA
jgi:hypothetical protein